MSLTVAMSRSVNYLHARLSYAARIASVLDVPVQNVKDGYAELHGSLFFQEISRLSGAKNALFDLSMMSPLRAQILYVVCRIVRPETVVETGVADGFSSSFILAALAENKRGRLHSIDLPNQTGHEVQGGKETGWMIPDALRDRWSLSLGSSRALLPSLLRTLRTVDIFFHDSDHGFENMMFEFNEAARCLRPQGILVSDDVTDNAAFDTFCAAHPCRHRKIFKTGIAVI